MDELTTKEKLMYAALDLFSQKGYDATSVDEIAESIGIKGPNIYRYFKGKKGLFEELVSNTKHYYFDNMTFETPVTTPEELKALSLKQIRYTISNDVVRKMRRIYTIEQFGNDEIARIATSFQFSNIIKLYQGIFISMIELGTIPKSDPELLALEYFAPVSLLIQVCDREPAKVNEAMALIERHIDFFIETQLKK